MDPQLHKLFVQPSIKNQSMLLGLASHVERLVTKAPVKKTVSDRIGRGISQGAEAIDYNLGRLTGLKRKESIHLTADHLRELDQKARAMDGGISGPAREKINDMLHRHNSLLRGGAAGDPYNKRETLDSLVRLAEKDPSFKVDLHDVEIPSSLGEGGKHVKNFATDIATFTGAAAIGDKLNRLSGPGEKQASSLEDPTMNQLDEVVNRAADCFIKAAELLDSLPNLDRAYDLAGQLKAAGVIESSEVEKRASIFANDLDAAEVLVADMLKAAASEKSASTFEESDFDDFEVVSTGGSSKEAQFSGFDRYFLDMQ